MKRFNLRVYALIINEFNEILLSDEYRFGQFFTKFPGGGVEPQEGIEAALHRELKEELGLVVNDVSFFYFNEFHQASAFDQSNLVAFYYLIRLQKHDFPASEPYQTPFEVEQEKQRWSSIQKLNSEDLTFPIDKIVLDRLQKTIRL